MASSIDFEIIDANTIAPKISKVTASQQKSKKSPKGEKSGQPTIFTTKQYKFLDKYLDTFTDLHGGSCAAQKKCWENLFTKY